MFKFTIDSNLIRAFNAFSSPDPTRPVIGSAILYPSLNGRSRIAGTDGSALISAFLDHAQFPDSTFPDFAVLLPDTKLKGTLTVTVTKDDDSVQVVYDNGSATEKYDSQTCTPPNLSQVIPQGPFVPANIAGESGINAGYIARIHSLSKYGLFGDRINGKPGKYRLYDPRDNPVLRFESPTADGLSPIMIRTTQWHESLRDPVIVLMPCR
jgi:hypothetical protein